MAKKQEVAEVEVNELALSEGYEEFAGAGFENQTADDYSIPFLHVLQAMSQAVEDNDDLKAGMIYNTVTAEAFDGKTTGICFIPVTTDHNYVEWIPRDQGGGFVGVHEVNSDLVRQCKENQEFGTFKTPDGNDLIQTYNVYGICVGEDGSVCEAVIAFSSSKIKKYKGWMTKAKTIQIDLGNGRRISAPLFAHKYRLSTVLEKNSKGSFYNWDIKFDGNNALEARLATSDPLFQHAVAIKKLIEDGKAKANFESTDSASMAGEDLSDLEDDLGF